MDGFRGCVLGLALGDTAGAPFEGGALERLLWRVIGTTKAGHMRWTDDTQMSLDLIESLVAKGRVDQDDLAARFSVSYRWSRGYGPATARVLKRIAGGENWEIARRAVYREGSFGNGAAMRAPVVGLFYAARAQELDEAARRSAEVTHGHALGVEGAVVIARATAAVLNGESNETVLRLGLECCDADAFQSRMGVAREWLAAGSEVAPHEVARRLGNGIAAAESCVTAVYLALRYRERAFEEMQRVVWAMGGDADTIGAMCGAIWGAGNGAAALPREWLGRLEERERIEGLAERLCERAG
ncbi:MAG TPA: ADP-ribosylglycohydrolase family protein [Phycisphaerales bacterium]|nr:ADP-ribosylglycohydrolase family protein [Phycisphaerales bacterium]